MDLEKEYQDLISMLIEQSSEYHKFVISEISKSFSKYPTKEVKRKSKEILEVLEYRRSIDMAKLIEKIRNVKYRL